MQCAKLPGGPPPGINLSVLGVGQGVQAVRAARASIKGQASELGEMTPAELWQRCNVAETSYRAVMAENERLCTQLQRLQRLLDASSRPEAGPTIGITRSSVSLHTFDTKSCDQHNPMRRVDVCHREGVADRLLKWQKLKDQKRDAKRASVRGRAWGGGEQRPCCDKTPG